jgi:hypothetical protein
MSDISEIQNNEIKQNNLENKEIQKNIKNEENNIDSEKLNSFDMITKSKNEFLELINNFENLIEKNDLKILIDSMEEFFLKNFENKEEYLIKTYTIIKKYKNRYSKDLSPEIKHQVYLYSQQPRENRKDLIEINPKILEALRVILYEKFTNLIVNHIKNFDKTNINVGNLKNEEAKIPLKRKRDEIYEEIEKFKIPTRLICPISKEIMEDPVFCPLGYTYDRKNITNWFKTSDTTPLTGEKLYIKFVTPNHLCKSDLTSFLQKIERKKKNQRIKLEKIKEKKELLQNDEKINDSQINNIDIKKPENLQEDNIN